jgi:transcriptional regulator with XRE-family HTH domain
LPRTALEPVCENLANVIRQQRKLRGLSLNGLAEMTSLSRQMISFIETNRRIPTIDSVARISRALGVPFSKLMWEAEFELQLRGAEGRCNHSCNAIVERKPRNGFQSSRLKNGKQ